MTTNHIQPSQELTTSASPGNIKLKTDPATPSRLIVGVKALLLDEGVKNFLALVFVLLVAVAACVPVALAIQYLWPMPFVLSFALSMFPTSALAALWAGIHKAVDKNYSEAYLAESERLRLKEK
jgi:hypothetical protein